MSRTLNQALNDLKTVLETGVGATKFQQQVSVWDYGILDNPKPRAIILKPGTISLMMETYGNQWVRTFIVLAELYVYYRVDGPADNVKRLLDALEDFDTILLDNFHLGLTIDDYYSASITSIGETRTVTRSAAQQEWYGAIISVAIQIPKAATAGAQ